MMMSIPRIGYFKAFFVTILSSNRRISRMGHSIQILTSTKAFSMAYKRENSLLSSKSSLTVA